jgi:SAM-dependent methyltransferase
LAAKEPDAIRAAAGRAQEAGAMRNGESVGARLAHAADLVRPRAVNWRALLPDDYTARLYPRKAWEYEFIAAAAEALGLLNGDKVALGIGVGSEPLIFFFARHARQVVATDLYSSQAAWSTARIDDIERIFDASPFPYPRERVSVRNADMRALPFADEEFDFCWSCSSIEHVDNLAQIVAVYNEIARVLKPGGYAILTTEFCVSRPPYPLPGVIALDPLLFRRIVGAHPGLEPLPPIDFTFDPLHLGNAPEARRYSWQGAVNPQHSSWRFRIGRMAQLCGLSAIAPIGFVLRRRGPSALLWNGLRLPAPLVGLTDALQSLDGGRPQDAIDRLEPYLAASTPQFQMIARRYHLDAMLRSGADPSVLRAVEDAFLAALPQGELQDADCVQMLAYSLGEHGRHGEAAAVYRRLAGAPGVLGNHALHLCTRYLKEARRAGSGEAAEAYLVSTVTDLLDHGAAWQQIEPDLRRELDAVEQPAEPILRALGIARRAGLLEWQERYRC